VAVGLGGDASAPVPGEARLEDLLGGLGVGAAARLFHQLSNQEAKYSVLTTSIVLDGGTIALDHPISRRADLVFT
jgi:hypothetical protein